MCSPGETVRSSNNNSNSSNMFLNINSSLTDLQTNQQDLFSENSSIADLDSSISLALMPFQPVSQSRATPLQAPSKKVNSRLIAGQDRLTTDRFATSNEHIFTSHRSGSPSSSINSTSDIWADPFNIVAGSPSSSLDYLRDIDLTPCTTLSTVPSITPSEEDFDEPYRHKKLLEIPDLGLEHQHRNRHIHQSARTTQSPTGIANLSASANASTSHPTNPYYKKVAGAIRRDISQASYDQHRQLQSRSVEISRDVIPSRRDPTPVQLNQNIRQSQLPQEYHDRPRQPYNPVPQATMHRHYYYNSQQQLQQRHNKVPHQQQHSHNFRSNYSNGNEPRSPHPYKGQIQSPNWHSPRSQPSSRNIPKSNSPMAPPHTPKQIHRQQQRLQQASSLVSSASPGAASARPTYEILKTLLRKKACLYETGTSRAIALITWLVGRKLALTQGYFSRQHLQSGVHAVVAEKIDTGMITRTKVNRCMQIILNSCFHYIIPRPDGTEEKGDVFRESFSKNSFDDSHLLDSLPHPWNDLKIEDDFLIDRSNDAREITEKCKEEDKSASKRIVLLCFNENVRCAEDVLRCHNDFIRDAAITGKLKLFSEEWRQFFCLKDDESSKSDTAPIEKTSLVSKPDGGCDIPYLTFTVPLKTSSSLNLKDNEPEPWSRCVDCLGQMNYNELTQFRTTWCCKRYDHDHSLCRFAHVDVNQGWLRRNPSVHKYSNQICPHTTIIMSATSSLKGCHLNTCPHGLNCKYAHSQEEIDYHPKQYKSTTCDAARPSSLNCHLRDICPKSHPENLRSPNNSKTLRSYHGKKTTDASARKGWHNGSSKHSNPNTSSATVANHIPATAPIIYHKPAPLSEFEETILFPGLQNLYRRNCAMVYAHFLGKEEVMQKYSNFGDNWDDEHADHLVKTNEASNKSFSLYSTAVGK